MPFTLSHPAIILPLAKASPKWVSLTGLIIGSLTPDFGYFIKIPIENLASHSLPGLFYFDLPMALLLTFAFHNIIRDPLYNNLPVQLGMRLLPYQLFKWNDYFRTQWAVIIPSILLGSASHLFWDGFTHGNGYFVQTVEELAIPVDIFGESIPTYRIFRNLSSLFGGLIVLYYLFGMPRDHVTSPNRSAHYWPILILIALSIILVTLAMGLESYFMAQLGVTASAAILIALIVTPLIDRKKYT